MVNEKLDGGLFVAIFGFGIQQLTTSIFQEKGRSNPPKWIMFN